MFDFKTDKILAETSLLVSLSFIFAGCGGGNSENNSETSSAVSIYHTVSFYDSNLDLIRTQSAANGTVIDLTAEGKTWHKANESAPLQSYTVNESINFYERAGVAEIADQAGLNSIRDNLSGHFILTDNITLTDGGGFDAQGWISIGDNDTPFSGILNGNNHTLSGLWMNRTGSSNSYDGLFGAIANGTIKNLGVETEDTGIQGYNYVGIIAGIITNSTITNSYTAGNVSGRNDVGGIAGFVFDGSKIARSYSSADVYGAWDGAGGIAGTIQGAPFGISAGFASISDSYTTGTVAGAASWVGGIAGNAQRWALINNCYASGNISATSSVGGIAGRVYYSSNITNNAAINSMVTGTYAGSSYVGAVEGENFGATYANTIENNFALNTINVQGGSARKTIIDFQAQQTYSDEINDDGLGGLGWKFGGNDTNPWQMSENGYPKLYWE
ncbi:MAG: hypothetical protein LBP54_06385 [Campylobacteraceae bacterium]|jgi:hypothetical protein|nr:hypothetical protein [Campylobacteraceae bacterium]